MNSRALHAICFAASLALFVCICLDCPYCASAQQTSSQGIVGRWRSLETSKGGIGTIIEFRSDGNVDFSPGAVVEMPWRIEKNQLILPPATTDGPEQKCTMKWLGDNKLRWETESGATELTRVGDRPSSSSPIIGEWTENREIGGLKVMARYVFYARGQVLLLIPFKIQRASYTISGSTLHMKMPNRNHEDRFKVTKDHLTLTNLENGQESHYARY